MTDFEEYIRQSEPGRQQKAYAWRTAIGLQAVDGLKPSEYLKDTARKHIEGEIDIDEAQKLIKSYYQSKTARTLENDLFANHSWYFRNTLVRANYRNAVKGVEPDMKYLVRFFRNLLFGENNELRNRYMVIDAPEEWKESVDNATPTSSPTSSPTRSTNQLYTSNTNIRKLVSAIGETPKSIREILELLNLKDRKNLLEYYVMPAQANGFVTLLYPDKPRHPRQKYVLTVKGLALLSSISKQ